MLFCAVLLRLIPLVVAASDYLYESKLHSSRLATVKRGGSSCEDGLCWRDPQGASSRSDVGCVSKPRRGNSAVSRFCGRWSTVGKASAGRTSSLSPRVRRVQRAVHHTKIARAMVRAQGAMRVPDLAISLRERPGQGWGTSIRLLSGSAPDHLRSHVQHQQDRDGSDPHGSTQHHAPGTRKRTKRSGLTTAFRAKAAQFRREANNPATKTKGT